MEQKDYREARRTLHLKEYIEKEKIFFIDSLGDRVDPIMIPCYFVKYFEMRGYSIYADCKFEFRVAKLIDKNIPTYRIFGGRWTSRDKIPGIIIFGCYNILEKGFFVNEFSLKDENFENKDFFYSECLRQVFLSQHINEDEKSYILLFYNYVLQKGVTESNRELLYKEIK